MEMVCEAMRPDDIRAYRYRRGPSTEPWKQQRRQRRSRCWDRRRAPVWYLGPAFTGFHRGQHHLLCQKLLRVPVR